MITEQVNRIGTAVTDHDIRLAFIAFVSGYPRAREASFRDHDATFAVGPNGRLYCIDFRQGTER